MIPKVLPILAYHYFTSSRNPCSGVKSEDHIYVLDEHQFHSHLRIIKSKAYVCPSVEQIPNLTGQDRCLITIDDGHISGYTIAYPQLESADFGATFFVSPGKIGKTSYMTWDQLREMADNGMSVGSHTYNHLSLKNIDAKTLESEVLDSKKDIEDHLGIQVISIALPMGYYDSKCLSYIKKSGYKYIFTSKHGYNLNSTANIYDRIMVKKSYHHRKFSKVIEFSYMNQFKYSILNFSKSGLSKLLSENLYAKIRGQLLASTREHSN